MLRVVLSRGLSCSAKRVGVLGKKMIVLGIEFIYLVLSITERGSGVR